MMTSSHFEGPFRYSDFGDMMHAKARYRYIADDRSTPLAVLLQKIGDICYYTYDLGDKYEHAIEVLEVIPNQDVVEHPKHPRSTFGNVALHRGVGAPPPEDGNGLEGTGNSSYAAFVTAYKKKPKKFRKKCQQLTTTAINYAEPWESKAPRKFDPLVYDVDLHRKVLGQMLAGPLVVKRDYREGGGFKEKHHQCTVCGDRLSCLITCAGCKTVQYCTVECQTADWPTHKARCSALNKARRKEKKAAREESFRVLAPGDTVSIFGLTSAVGGKYNGCEGVVAADQPSNIKIGRVALQLARNDPENPATLMYEFKSFKKANIRVLYQEAAGLGNGRGGGAAAGMQMIRASHYRRNVASGTSSATFST